MYVDQYKGFWKGERVIAKKKKVHMQDVHHIQPIQSTDDDKHDK
jgi:hypothetical protein